jgi:hypothetical protein
MITGLPDYRPSIEQSLRCTCGIRYVVYLGGAPAHLEMRAQAAVEQARILRARFVDARVTPFANCECGEVLDFTHDDSVIQ